MSSVRCPRLLLLCIGLAATSSCKTNSSGAKEHFAREFSCPEGRVTVASSSTKWGDLVLSPSKEEAPDEVKKDPARLAKWQEDHDETERERRSSANSLDTFDVNGCGHVAVVACWHRTYEGGSVDPGTVVCQHREKK